MSKVQPSSQLTENLLGALDIMLGRSSGLARMDTSSEGFWWSFAGLGLTGLIDASAYAARYGVLVSANTAELPSRFAYIGGSVMLGLTAYALSMAVVYFMCRGPREQQRFAIAVIAHNWAAPIVSVAVLPFVFLSTNSPSGVEAMAGFWNVISVLILGVLITVGIRIMRISLDLTVSRAVLFFAVSTLTSLVVVEWLERAFGLSF